MTNMNATETKKGGHSFEERIPDLLRIADGGRIAAGPFLTPGERVLSQKVLNSLKCSDRALFFGGYSTAERTRLYCLPDYLEKPESEDGTDEMYRILAEDDNGIVTLLIRASGYVPLTHRDYLGALLGLGIERDSVGDILVDRETYSARLFCTASMASFLETNVCQIGADTVRVERLPFEPDFRPVIPMIPISDTVASPRLDCVVAALASVSREEAQRLVRSGLVELDYFAETRPDRTLEPPHILSVRGYGKYRLNEFGDINRRGRLRMRAEKYV